MSVEGLTERMAAHGIATTVGSSAHMFTLFGGVPQLPHATYMHDACMQGTSGSGKAVKTILLKARMFKRLLTLSGLASIGVL